MGNPTHLDKGCATFITPDNDGQPSCVKVAVYCVIYLQFLKKKIKIIELKRDIERYLRQRG